MGQEDLILNHFKNNMEPKEVFVIGYALICYYVGLWLGENSKGN